MKERKSLAKRLPENTETFGNGATYTSRRFDQASERKHSALDLQSPHRRRRAVQAPLDQSQRISIWESSNRAMNIAKLILFGTMGRNVLSTTHRFFCQAARLARHERQRNAPPTYCPLPDTVKTRTAYRDREKEGNDASHPAPLSQAIKQQHFTSLDI